MVEFNASLCNCGLSMPFQVFILWSVKKNTYTCESYSLQLDIIGFYLPPRARFCALIKLLGIIKKTTCITSFLWLTEQSPIQWGTITIKKKIYNKKIHIVLKKY